VDSLPFTEDERRKDNRKAHEDAVRQSTNDGADYEVPF
jgi:hypothetical protein